MAHRIWLLATVGVFSVALAACGATDQTAQPSAGTTPAAATPSTLLAGSSGGSQVPSGDFRQSGIVVSQCLADQGLNLKLTLHDATTGKVLAVRSVSLGSTSGPICGLASSAPKRFMFDSAYDRLAVTIRTTGEGGSPGTHVGFLDLRTGQLTDVTALRVKAGGFSTISAQDTAPAFGPGNTFWYYSTIEPVHVYSADVATGLSTERPRSSIPTELCWTATFPCAGLPSDPAVALGDNAINPSRTAVFHGGSLYLAPDWRDATQEVNCDQTACAGAGSLCPATAWLDDYRVICDGGGNRFALVSFSHDYRQATGRPILPNNDRNNMSPVGSPDRSSIAFISSKTDGPRDWSIYRTSPNGGSEPTRVGDLPVDNLGAPATLIEWK